jgi:hypothetical protein
LGYWVEQSSGGGSVRTLCFFASFWSLETNVNDGRFVPHVPASIPLMLGCEQPIALAISDWLRPARCRSWVMV